MRLAKNKKDIVLLSVIGIIFVAAISIFLVIFQSNLPKMKAENEAKKIAKKYAQLTEVDNFYLFTRKQTYYTVTGKNDKNEDIIVIVPKDGGNITVLNAKDCINYGQAEATVKDRNKGVTGIKSSSIGMYDNKPVWELVGTHANGRISYYLLGLKDGQNVGKTKNF